VDTATGYASWVMWVVLIVGTAAFWAVIFAAVRALVAGRSTGGSPHADSPRYPDSQE
jgi:hypothetical protein